MRVTILRRQATYVERKITGHIVKTYVDDELIVWVILSEVAKKIIEKHNLYDRSLYSVETDEAYRKEAKEKYDYDPGKYFHYLVKEFVVDPPYITGDPDHEREPLIREGLKNLNDLITKYATTPTTSSKSFEL